MSSVPALAQEFAPEQLEASPRHHEWVEVESGDRVVHSFVAYPERSEDATAVIVIHENRGLTDWVRSFADQLAEAGYIAIAPDLLSNFDAEHNRTTDFSDSDAARDAIYQLDPVQVTTDLLAVQDYASEIPAANGAVAVAGFCWGGAQAFRFATDSPAIKAAFVFYGSPPEEGLGRIEAPVYGFYGEDDQRINATIEDTAGKMKESGKSYEYVIYDGAGHGFMRSGDDPAGSAENKVARDQAWERLKSLLGEVG
jgi:carboxymethylenebutenolidase